MIDARAAPRTGHRQGITDRTAEGTLRWVTAEGGLDPIGNACFLDPTTDPNAPGLDCISQDRVTHCGPPDGGDWHYLDCGEMRPFVCERDGAPRCRRATDLIVTAR